MKGQCGRSRDSIRRGREAGTSVGLGGQPEEGQTPPAQNDLLTAVSPPSPGLPPLLSAHLLADGTRLLAELTVV